VQRLKVHAEVSSAGELDRLEIVWKGQVAKTVAASGKTGSLAADLELDADDSGWFAARAFEKPGTTVRFAQTSPVYVRVGSKPGVVPKDAEFFLAWIDREMKFYEGLSGFRSESDRQGMLAFFRQARAVYERLAATASSSR
jgi:hypothetical protein